MVSFTTATARSPAPSSPSKKIYNGGHINDALSSPGTTWQRGGPTQSDTHKAKSGKHKRQTSLLDRLSLPCAPLSPSGTLLERIGGSVQDEAVSEGVDGDRVSTGAGVVTHSPFSTLPHYYTPEPDEVERFLQSVIGAPPPPPSPSSPHACLVCPLALRTPRLFIYVTIKGTKPTLVLDTDNLPVKLVDESSSSVLYSPTQTAVNSLPSAHLALDPCQHSPLLGDTAMPPLSATALEECRTHLVPVLVASAHARDPGTRLDADQCHKLLTDDHCNRLFRQAEKMRQQLASRVSHKIQTPADQGWRGSLKRDRVEDVDAWVRRTRSRFDSVYSDMSRRDSDITLVDFPGGRLPPKAPRAMLKASQAFLTKSLDDAPYEGLVASPIAEDHPTSLSEQAIKMFPVLGPPAVAEPVEMSTGDPSATNFVSHLPTQPGIWFKQQGRDHAEIVDVDIDVTEDMFYMSRERYVRPCYRAASFILILACRSDCECTSASVQCP